jgi:hypothetical protein
MLCKSQEFQGKNMKPIAMMIMFAALGSLALTAPITVTAATPAVPVLVGNISCSSYIPGPLTIKGNVKVPDGASCELGYMPDPSTPCCNPTPPPGYGLVWVTGNVTVGRGSNLSLGLNSTVVGNLQANHCGFVEFVSEGSEFVQGNVQISHCDGSTPGEPAFLSTGTGSRIHGNFECRDNTGPCILEGAIVGGNAQMTNNVTDTPSMIYDSHIFKNLECQKNVPLPIGDNNTVAGKKQGQCAKF